MNIIYKSIPSPLQDIAVSIVDLKNRRLRYGKEFDTILSEISDYQFKTNEEIKRFKKERLYIELERASRTKYYSKLFKELGYHWSDFVDLSIFEKLPITTKSDVINNPNDFIPRSINKNDIKVNTSGTSGKSLVFYMDKNFIKRQWAYWWRYRLSLGVKLDERCALFASAPIVPPSSNNRMYRTAYASNEYRFSIFHISNSNIRQYVKDLNHVKAPWIHGNPSAIAQLARLMNENGLKLNYPVKFITVGSENLQPWYISAIEKAFGIKPVEHYGLSEGVANISTCPLGNLHIDEDFSHVELIPHKDSNNKYSIIGSSFYNSAFSLLRYEAGDSVTFNESSNSMKRCKCGRSGRIIDSIDGRLTDFITLPNGKVVASLAGPFHETSGFSEAQLYQSKDGNLIVRYVPNPEFSSMTLVALEKSLRIRVGSEVKISFKRVEEVERTPRGKIKLVISDYKYM